MRELLERLNAGFAQQEKLWRDVIDLAKLQPPIGAARFAPATDPSAQGPQRDALAPWQDDYRELVEAHADAERQALRFRQRWRAQPVVQVTEDGCSLLISATAEDNPVMWILSGVSDAGTCPVVLSPAAAAALVTDRERHRLAAATNGFFTIIGEPGGRPMLERPAAARLDGRRAAFLCVEPGAIWVTTETSRDPLAS